MRLMQKGSSVCYDASRGVLRWTGEQRKQLLSIVRGRHDPKVTEGWIRVFIGQHLEALQTCRSLPEEEARFTVPGSQLDEDMNTLRVHLTGKCAELALNLDELRSAA
jgi:hypothetical protein